MGIRLDALTVRETEGKSYWTRIGVAFPNREGHGYMVKLDAMPASKDGQYVIHLREPRNDSAARSTAKTEPYGATGGAWDNTPDLDDDVPGF